MPLFNEKDINNIISTFTLEFVKIKAFITQDQVPFIGTEGVIQDITYNEDGIHIFYHKDGKLSISKIFWTEFLNYISGVYDHAFNKDE